MAQGFFCGKKKSPGGGRGDSPAAKGENPLLPGERGRKRLCPSGGFWFPGAGGRHRIRLRARIRRRWPGVAPLPPNSPRPVQPPPCHSAPLSPFWGRRGAFAPFSPKQAAARRREGRMFTVLSKRCGKIGDMLYQGIRRRWFLKGKLPPNRENRPFAAGRSKGKVDLLSKLLYNKTGY